MSQSKPHDVTAHAAVSHGEPDARYVLITECLQNDFLLNRECRLYIGDEAARTLLIGRDGALPDRREARLKLDRPAAGPLGAFLNGTVGLRLAGKGAGVLHLINIRDWHVADESYDRERRAYGPHCEAGTWGARYVEGLEPFLDPACSPAESKGVDYDSAKLVVRHVHADSIFDFRPRWDDVPGTRPEGGKFPASQLEQLLDELVLGTDADGAADNPVPIYVAAVGVYSDIKVLTLLAGLRTRYDLPNLAISDSLTASATLERHIAGLDFTDKLLGVEVLHGINDLARFLGGEPIVENEHDLVSADSFTRYRSFFQDKQSVLASESERLRDYLALTEKRALETYMWIRNVNWFLFAFGSLALLTTLGLAIAGAAGADVKWQITAVTGGVSMLQLVSAFYSKPMRDLQRNLANLAVFKMILESRSLKTALGRFHLTTPQALRELQTEEEAVAARRQVELLQAELALLEESDRADFTALENLGFGEGVEAAANGGGATARTP
jgi:hypothetical protein